MGKLRVFSGHEMCRLLETNGFVTVRQAGSHRILQRRGEVGTITIPVPMHSELRRGTLLSIVRQCGLERRLFETES